MSSPNLFSASESAIGYLFQCRLALLESIKRIRSNSADGVSIEALDDISFEEAGTPTELLQTKHHIKTSNLTDSSSDIWKTIRVWIEFHRNSNTAFGDVILYLVTTADTPADTAASALQRENRDIDFAVNKLAEAAATTTSVANQEGATAFLGLLESERKSLVESIYILARQDNIEDVREQLKQQLILNVREEHLEPFLNHVEGWWFHWCVQHLMQSPPIAISLSSLHRQIVSLAEQFEAENLPVSPWDEADAIEADSDTRTFVIQLREVGLTNRGIELAVRNYYRAFEHRSRWNREDLLFVGELAQYEKKLVDEWEQHFENMKAGLANQGEADIQRARGMELYQNLSFNRHVAIRPKVSEEFIYRGSLHMLADELKIGWHISFRDRLTKIMVEVEK